MDARTPDAIAGKPPLTHGEIRSIFYGLMLAMFLSALDQTIVATAMPTIGRELGDVRHLPWIVTAYLLAATAVTPLYGKLADMHGRRLTLLVAIGIFVAGSAACALAPSLPALAVARGLQGLGGGGLIALAQTIIADMVSPRERGRYQVYFASVFAAASVLGPVLGGFFAETLHWSWIFWINLPLGLVALWLVNDKLRKLPGHHRPHRLDILGAVLMIGATSALMLAVSWGGGTYPWASAPIIGLLGASVLLWVAFAARLLSAAEPLIPLAVLGDRVVATAIAAGALSMGTYIGLAVTVPVYFEASLGLSARQSGLALIPFMVGTPLGATIAGRAMGTKPRYKRITVMGLAAAVGCICGFAATAGRGPFWLAELLLGLAAIGIGTVFPVATVALQNAVASHHLGSATASMNFMRQLAGAVIVSIFGAIALGGSGLAREAGAAHGAIDVAAFPTVFWLAAAGLAAALLAFVVMEERPLHDRTALSPERALDEGPGR